MKIESRKITQSPKSFALKLHDESYDVDVLGSLRKLSNGLVRIDSTIIGKAIFVCDMSGEEFSQDINEQMTLFANDGIWKGGEEKLDVIEFFDGYIDLGFVFQSELASMQLDYHTKTH